MNLCGRQISCEAGSLVAALLATHFEDRQKCVRWSLFSIALLTLVAWARHARAVMVNERRWGIVDPSLLRRSWRTTPPLLLQWLMHHLTTQTSQSNCITRCFLGETVENSNSDQMEVCLVCASRSTCVDVYTAGLCSCSAHALTGLLGEVQLFSLFPWLFVSLQHLRALMAGGVGASVTNTLLTGVLSTDRSSGITSTLTTRHRYSLFPPSFFPMLVCHFLETSLLGCSHLQPVYALRSHLICQEVKKWVNMPQRWFPH